MTAINLQVLVVAVTGWVRCLSAAPATAGEPDQLSRKADTYFMENDLVYTRFLWFQSDGLYHQINRDRTTAEEVDRGTWEQRSRGEVILHPVNGMLLYRALSSGPLLVMLDTQARIDTLPVLRGKIASFLQSYQDSFFARSGIFELRAAAEDGRAWVVSESASVELPETSDTFERSDLEQLLRWIDLWSESKSRGAFTFDHVTDHAVPDLLIQRGAVYSQGNLANVRASYRVLPGTPPPFYFARIDKRTFLSRAGKWKPFANLGGTGGQNLILKKSP